MTYPTFVDSINESDESPRQVPFPVAHTRDPGHDEGVVGPHELQIVSGTGCPSYQLVKSKPRCLTACFWHFNVAPPNLMHGPVRRFILRIAEEAEPFFCMRNGRFVERVVVDARWRARDLPVVGVGVEVKDPKTSFEKVDAGDERLPLDAVFVEVVWVPIGCSDQYDAVGHQCFEQSGSLRSEFTEVIKSW